MHPTDISSTGGITRPRWHINSVTSRERQRNDHPKTIHSVPSLSVGAPEHELQSVTEEQHAGLRPSILWATSTTVSSLSASSARNRHHGPVDSASPVSVQDTIPVTNTSGPQSAPLSVSMVIIPETIAIQPTTVSEGQAVYKTNQALTDTKPCYPSASSVSAPITHGIRIVRPSPALVRPSAPTVYMNSMDHNDLAGVLQESGRSGPHHEDGVVDGFSSGRYMYIHRTWGISPILSHHGRNPIVNKPR